MARPPTWAPETDAIIVADWPAGVEVEEIMKKIPGRSVHAIGQRASVLGVKRPRWFTQMKRRKGGHATDMRRKGKVFWSRAATDRLVKLVETYSVAEAAKRMGIKKNQAIGRLYRIGWKGEERLTDPREPDDTPYEPTVHAADRMAALMERAREMGVT